MNLFYLVFISSIRAIEFRTMGTDLDQTRLDKTRFSLNQNKKEMKI